MLKIALAAAAVTMVATPALAGEPTGYQEIARGDYASAEQVIAKERRNAPNDPDLLVNLAAIYLNTGRTTAAQSLYRRVLAQPDVTLERQGGAEQSHALAARALTWLDARKVASN